MTRTIARLLLTVQCLLLPGFTAKSLEAHPTCRLAWSDGSAPTEETSRTLQATMRAAGLIFGGSGSCGTDEGGVHVCFAFSPLYFAWEVRSDGCGDQGSYSYHYLGYPPSSYGGCWDVSCPECTDLDSDGHGAQLSPLCGNWLADCDDSDPQVRPTLVEGPVGDPTCSDQKDNDCDGRADLSDAGCNPCVGQECARRLFNSWMDLGVGETWWECHAVGDVDGNGLGDLVAGSSEMDGIVAHLANEMGTFMEAGRYPVHGEPRHISLADLDGNGTLDAAVVDSSQTISIFSGNGDGTFTYGEHLFLECRPDSLVEGDWNLDGLADLALGCSDSRVYVLLAREGLGLLSRNYWIGYDAWRLDAEDMDQDGWLDLVASGIGEKVSVLRNNGAGGFLVGDELSTGLSLSAQAVGDLDGDFSPDLVLGDDDGSVHVMFNNGDGTLGAPVEFEGIPGFSLLGIADLDQDQTTDLLLSGMTLSVLFGYGNREFMPPYPYSGLADGRNVFLTHLDRDVFVDGVRNLGGLAVLYGSPGQGFLQPEVIELHADGRIHTGDLDADGRLDLVFPSTPYRFAILFGNGNGTFTEGVPLQQGESRSRFVAIGSLDNDGFEDLVASFGYNIRVYLNDRQRGFLPASEYQVDWAHYPFLAVADLNGDERGDVVVLEGNGAVASLMLGNGDGSLQDRISLPLVGRTTDALADDLNRDGHVDLVFAHSPAYGLEVLLGNGDGSFQNPLSIPLATEPVSVISCDFNRDLLPDLAVSGESEDVWVLQGNGDGTFHQPRGFSAGTSSQGLTCADLNNDGMVDLILVLELPSQVWGKVSVLLGNGDSTFQPPVYYGVFDDANSVVAGDFNGDGGVDLVVDSVGAERDGLSLLFNALPCPVDLDHDGQIARNCGGTDCRDSPDGDEAGCQSCSCSEQFCSVCARCQFWGANEACQDGFDNDCDGRADEGDYSCPCRDGDGDGFGTQENPACLRRGVDCNDAHPLVNPGFPEIMGNGIDDDCDGGIDEECFVATAAFGTPLQSRIEVLRRFRDRVLLHSEIGRALVHGYYERGPAAADWIAVRPCLRALARTVLSPVIGLLWLVG